MKYKGYDSYGLDYGEPVLRSCWECNGAHEYLKNSTTLSVCQECGRNFIHGRFFDEFKSTADLDAFLKEKLEAPS